MTEQYYREKAFEARSQAEAATLPNVKERCQRSADKWLEMADRVADTEVRKRSNLSAR